MSLLELLQSEAVKRGLLGPATEIDAAKAFALVRDMLYLRASSREPKTTILEWRGTCSGKHYLLKALFAELGLRSRVMACTTELQVDPNDVTVELRPILEDSGGRIVDVHNYLVLELPHGDMIVDATWPLATKGLGLTVNETFILGEDQRLACTPIERWGVPEDRDPQEFKNELLREHFTPEELEHREKFIRTFSMLLTKHNGDRGIRMEIKTKLVDLLQRAREEERTFFAGLSDGERSAIGTPEHWSVKDVAAHLAEWKVRMGQRLAGARRGEMPPTYDDVDEANAEIFEQYRNQSWADVLKALERAHSELVEQTRAMAEGDLVDPERFPWQDGRPLWRSIVGSGYLHPVQHLAQLYVERGERDYATQMQETAAELLASLDDSPSWRGVTVYNLACHYALSGEREKAIAKLGEALRLNPDLTEWSKQDPDFASIREEPAYRSLYVA